jgi:hypothetical protein
MSDEHNTQNDSSGMGGQPASDSTNGGGFSGNSQGGGQPMVPTPPAPPAGGVTGGGLSGIMDEDVDVGDLVQNAGANQQQSQQLLSMPIPPHPNTTFDEQKFLSLLAGSISLTPKEKVRIVENIPKLSQFQIDELIKIFEEEKGKFAELEKKHAEQLAELEKQHGGSWEAIQQKKEEEAKREQEKQQEALLLQQLGLGEESANSEDYGQSQNKAA